MAVMTASLFGLSIVATVLALLNYWRSACIRREAKAMYDRANLRHQTANQAHQDAVKIKMQAERVLNRILTYQRLN